MGRILLIAAVTSLVMAQPANAAALDGATLAWPWALPFVGILLTIATGPLLFPKLWHHHYGKLAFAWSVLTLAPLALVYSWSATAEAFVHTLLAEYLSFIILLFTLYVVAGGILITGNLRGTPLVNTGLLTFGTLIASIVGTTGAAMILIRPLLHANALRPRNAHVVVFFILLVANIGGSLSPLGDPPLFVGFLRGVDFFWTTQHLWWETGLVAGLLLVVFFILDHMIARRDNEGEAHIKGERLKIRISGVINLLLIACIIGTIVLSATWKPGVAFHIYGTDVALQNIVRDVLLLVFAFASMRLTPREHRESNGFTFEPIREVAILFAGIFTCIIPVLAMLQAGRNGTFAPLIDTVTHADGSPNVIAYFWMTGLLSAFLDNAPTYLVFYELAGGRALELMTTLKATLAAISMGSVYMGALTYIGNAPNFMVYAIATERGVKMPSFFGYMAWSIMLLVPPLILLSLIGIG